MSNIPSEKHLRLTKMKVKLSLKVTTPPLSEVEMLDSLSILEAFQDAAACGEFDTKSTMRDTLTALKNVKDTRNPNFLSLIAEQPEFYGMSLEDVGTKIDSMFKSSAISPAQEGHLEDYLHDGLIGMIIHWDDHTTSELKKLIPTMRERIQNADESNFGKWKLFFQIGVYSKYLPDAEDFPGAASCLTNCFKYLKSVKPGKFDAKKYVTFYQNTCYNENDWVQEYTKKAQKAMVAGVLSNLASLFIPFASLIGVYFKWESDIRKRGWTDRNDFLMALGKAEALVREMESLSATVSKYKGTNFKENEYVQAKAYFKAAEQTIKLSGYLGRGIVAASRSIGGSMWRRLFTLDR